MCYFQWLTGPYFKKVPHISENVIDSYVIVELLYVLLYWLAASKVGVELVFSRVDVGVLIG